MVLTISDSGGNFDDTATWVEGVVPTDLDDVVATATSGQLTVNVYSFCRTLDFTNYVSTLTVNDTLEVGYLYEDPSFAFYIVFVSAMTITTSGGTPVLRLNASILGGSNFTITSNSKVWPGALENSPYGGVTNYFADNFTILGGLTLNSTITINNNTLTIGGGFNNPAFTFGTTNLVMNGTGTWTGGGITANNLTINTAGTITISGLVGYADGTLTYTAGTILQISDPQIRFGVVNSGPTLNIAGITWQKLGIFSSNTTLTINSYLTAISFLNYEYITTFTGAFGCSFSNLIITTAADDNSANFTLEQGNTYTVTNSFRLTHRFTTETEFFGTISSSDATLTTNLNYTGTDQYQTSVYFNATRINSSGGNNIKFWRGTMTSTTNWSDISLGKGGAFTFLN
jgi:hypothetical protein